MKDDMKKCGACGKEVTANGMLSGPPSEEFLMEGPPGGNMEFSAQLFDTGITEEALRKLQNQLKNLKVDQKTIGDVTKKLQDSVNTIQNADPNTAPSTNTMKNTTTNSENTVVSAGARKRAQELLMTIPELPIEDVLMDMVEDSEEPMDDVDEIESEENPDGEIETTQELEQSDDPEAEAKAIGDEIGIDWDEVDFTPADLLAGIQVEMEHGEDPETNVTDDSIVDTAKIAWAHLKEMADYYTKLDKMEKSSKVAQKEEFIVQIVDGKGNELHAEYCSAKDLKGVFDKSWNSLPEFTTDTNADVVVTDLKSKRRQYLDLHPSLAEV
jgi:hypothetical protein